MSIRIHSLLITVDGLVKNAGNGPHIDGPAGNVQPLPDAALWVLLNAQLL